MMPFPGPGSSKKCLFPATEQGKVIKDTVPRVRKRYIGRSAESLLFRAPAGGLGT